VLTLPAALRPLAASPHWVTWRWVTRAGGSRDKPPFNPRNPQAFASTRRPDSWAGFDLAAAVVARQQADGVGYVLLLDERLIALDLDDCRDPRSGALAPWAIALVEEADSYTEITPSGAGLRILGLNESIAASLCLQLVLVAITIAWPESVTYWLLAGTGIDSQHGDHRRAATHRAG
jgi:primase-polymerase (primpol)-like protein